MDSGVMRSPLVHPLFVLLLLVQLIISVLKTKLSLFAGMQKLHFFKLVLRSSTIKPQTNDECFQFKSRSSSKICKN